MLLSVRRVAIPELEAAVDRLVAWDPTFLVRLVMIHGVIADDVLLEGVTTPTIVPRWPVLTIALDGTGVVRQKDAAILGTTGELVWAPSGAEFRARSGDRGVRCLVVQWDPRVLSGPTDARLTRAPLRARDFASIGAAADRIALSGYDTARARDAVDALFDVLRALGFVDARPPREPSATTRLARAGEVVDQCLSNLSANPTALDIEGALRCSPAHARRTMQSYVARLGFSDAKNWRELRTSWRLYMGALLMTSPRATTDLVARALGYGSPVAFCHAFTNAGLPSPGSVRAAVDRLG
jgi:hypothetical protein